MSINCTHPACAHSYECQLAARGAAYKRPARSLSERIADADMRGSEILARANEAAEAGDKERAEKLYSRGQKWLDESNRLRGCD